MADTVTQEDLLTSLEGGDLVLLPGSFAARSWRRLYDARQRSRGLKAWESARALAWFEWTSSLWTQLISSGAESRVLLNATQEQGVWSEIIVEHSPTPMAPEAIDSLVVLARSASGLAASWGITQRLHGAAATHDTRTFARWAAEFEQRCATHGYLASSQLDYALAQHLDRGAVPLPDRLLLANFPEFAPAQKRLLAALRSTATAVEFVSVGTGLGAAPPGSRITVASGEREELLLAATWARSQVNDGPAPTSPKRIGFLLPENAVEPLELEGVLREVLAPELHAIGTDLSSTPWEFAAGRTLSSVPLLTTSLDVLRLCTGSLSLEATSSLLLSPYLGQSADRDVNGRFDARSLRGRTRLRPQINLAALKQSAADFKRADSTGASPAPWLAPLEEVSTNTLDAKLRRSFSEWMEVIRQVLKVAGFPGDRPLNPFESASIRAWEDTLDEIATLDFAGKRVPFADAFSAVQRKALTATVTASGPGTSITVLSLDEAVGASWDALIFLRATEENWPPAPRLHPLLPAGLQRDLGMPGTRPEREVHLIRSVLATSPLALATCAAENADGPLRAAPLFKQLGFTSVEAAAIAPPLPFTPIDDVCIPDSTALPPLPSPEVRGGARVLEMQAACGFLAFAAIRLGATEVEAREAGFDARESGNLLHRSLEHFWREVRSQSALRALPSERLRELLRASVDKAFTDDLPAESTWDQAYLLLQKERLHKLLHVWLSHELRRGDFTVAESERAAVVPVGPLRLRVRVDRVDEVEGGLVLVDYKTGYAADPKGWNGDRPDQPQLPLYSLLCEPEEIKAITFARVRAGKTMNWIGLESETGILTAKGSSKRTNVNLVERMEEWRSTLTQLASDFNEGRANVDPKDFTKNCKHCEQRLLCRLDPASLDAQQLIEDEEEAEDFFG